MKLVILPIIVALIAQCISLPFFLGGQFAGETVGWSIITMMFFGIPSIIVYCFIFGTFRMMAPPAWLTVVLGTLTPGVLMFALFPLSDKPFDFTHNNWVLWSGTIGSIVGTITYLYIRFTMNAPSSSVTR